MFSTLTKSAPLTRGARISLLMDLFMPELFMLHLIKLCVGVDSLQELADWQKKRLKEKRAKGQKPELMHITRQFPKRAEELLDGGSLYWVIKRPDHGAPDARSNCAR